MSERLNGAQAVWRCLEAEGVSVIFGYPGGAVLPLYDALLDSSVRHILVRHEQAAVHAADAYARVTGQVGVCLATSGPGATNLVTGLANAYMDSIPVIAVTGQVTSRLIGRDAFQEADVTGITLPITKHNYLVQRPEDLPRVFREAFHIARTGRPGPVLIDIPKDVQSQMLEYDYPAQLNLPGYRPTVLGNPRQIQLAAEAIASAERPVIIAGGGVVSAGASGLVRDLAEMQDIPVVTTLMGIGAMPVTHPQCFGLLGMHGRFSANRAVSESDLVIALGMRFDDRVTGGAGRYAPRARVVHVDVDPAEIGKNRSVDIPIVGDVGKVLEALLPSLRAPALRAAEARRAWLAQVQDWERQRPIAYEESDDRPLKPQRVIEEISRLAGPEAICVVDVGQHQMWAAQLWNHQQPRRFLSSSGLGTMGFGLPAAIGAQVAAPGGEVWLVVGDGGLQMTLQELATAVQEELPIRIAVINNGFLGMVRQWQEMFHRRRYSAVQFGPWPDFVRLAEAFGLPGLRVQSLAEVGPALTRARLEKGPVLIDFIVDPEECVFPMVPPGQGIEKMILGPDVPAVRPVAVKG